MDAWPAKFTPVGTSEIEVRSREFVVVAFDLPSLRDALLNKGAINGQEDLPLTVTQPWIVGYRLGNPNRPALRVDHYIAERGQQGTWIAAEFALEAYRHPRTRNRLAVKPLRHRCLRHAK